MSILDQLGVCRYSGCEAAAVDCGETLLLIGRPALFAGINLGSYAVASPQLVRNMLDHFAKGDAAMASLRYLYDVLASSGPASRSRDEVINGLSDRIGTSLAAFELPKIVSGEREYARSTREPTVVEPEYIDRMLRVVNYAVERHVAREFVDQIRDLVDPTNILVTSATLVGVAVVAASGVGTGVLAAVGFALKGWEIFGIIRTLIRFVDAFMVGDENAAAMLLGAAFAALGVAVLGIFLRRVGGRVRRPRVEPRRPSPSDNPDFSDVNTAVGITPSPGTGVGSRTVGARVQGAVTDARAAGWIDAAGNPRGSVGAATQPHRRATDVRDATGHTGATRQSAHVGATSLLKALPGYSRGDAITVLMDPNSHRTFDQHWLDWVRQQRRGGQTSASLQEILAAQRRAIDQITGMTNQQRGTLAWMLEREIAQFASAAPSGLGTMVPLPNIR